MNKLISFTFFFFIAYNISASSLDGILEEPIDGIDFKVEIKENSKPNVDEYTITATNLDGLITTYKEEIPNISSESNSKEILIDHDSTENKINISIHSMEENEPNKEDFSGIKFYNKTSSNKKSTKKNPPNTMQTDCNEIIHKNLTEQNTSSPQFTHQVNGLFKGQCSITVCKKSGEYYFSFNNKLGKIASVGLPTTSFFIYLTVLGILSISFITLIKKQDIYALILDKQIKSKPPIIMPNNQSNNNYSELSLKSVLNELEGETMIDENFKKAAKQVILDNIVDINASKFKNKMSISSNLSEYMKDKVKMTFREFHRQTRLELGKKKLVETDDNISTIAYQIGFQRDSSFTKAFTLEYGISPRAYRKNIKI